MLHLKESLRILKWLNPALKDDMIMLVPIWDFSPTWLDLFRNQDYHAAEAETSLLLYWCPEVVRDKPSCWPRRPDSTPRVTSDTTRCASPTSANAKTCWPPPNACAKR